MNLAPQNQARRGAMAPLSPVTPNPVTPNPVTPFEMLRRELDRVFDQFGDGFFELAPFSNGRLLPNADYAETDKEIVITAELPGVDAKDVDVSLADNVLTIRGEKRSERNEKKERYQLAERAYGQFERAITVPDGVDPAKVEAKFDKGVLTVKMPKPAEAKRQKIEIKPAT